MLKEILSLDSVKAIQDIYSHKISLKKIQIFFRIFLFRTLIIQSKLSPLLELKQEQRHQYLGKETTRNMGFYPQLKNGSH